NQATTTLQQIAFNNAVQSSFTFYTNGSVTDIGTDRCLMGIGWVQILNNQVLHQFSASIKLWPSSYKAELMAILLAITTVSRNSQVYIFTDSQSVISKYQTLITLNHASTKQFKSNYWP